MNNIGFSLSLALFLICLIVAASVHFSESSYNRECPCVDSVHCCLETATLQNPPPSGLSCENKCYCPFHKDSQASCVGMNEKYKETSKLIVGISGILVLVGLISAILFYFEPWYDCTCCCCAEVEDDASILQNSVIPRYITLKELEERASQKINK